MRDHHGKKQSRGNDRQRFQRREVSSTDDGTVRLFGIHAVEAALQNPRREIGALRLTENAEQRLADAITKCGVKPARTGPSDLDRLLGPDTVHQGACLDTVPLPEPSLEDLAETAMRGGPIVVLDQVTDPHNVGAILRSAAAFAATGLVMTRRHSPPLTGTLAKSASGALEHVPVALVPNLAQALEKLADLGIETIGLDGEATDRIEDHKADGAVAIVLGSEGKGLRRLTRERCTRLCRIATTGSLASLNVSNAAAIALHTIAVAKSRAAQQ